MSPRAWTVVRRQFHKHPDLRIVTEGEFGERYGGVQPDLGPELVIRVRGPSDLPLRTTAGTPVPMEFGVLPEPSYRQRPVEDSQAIWDAFVAEWGSDVGTAVWKSAAAGVSSSLTTWSLIVATAPTMIAGTVLWPASSATGTRVDGYLSKRLLTWPWRLAGLRRSALRDEQLEVFERRLGWAPNGGRG